jgi:hypothetical protein
MAKKTNPSPTFPMFPGGALDADTLKSDVNNLPYPSVIYVGVTGAVNVMTSEGDTATFTGVPAGTVIPVQVIRIFSTGTTATSLVAIY